MGNKVEKYEFPNGDVLYKIPFVKELRYAMYSPNFPWGDVNKAFITDVYTLVLRESTAVRPMADIGIIRHDIEIDVDKITERLLQLAMDVRQEFVPMYLLAKKIRFENGKETVGFFISSSMWILIFESMQNTIGNYIRREIIHGLLFGYSPTAIDSHIKRVMNTLDPEKAVYLTGFNPEFPEFVEIDVSTNDEVNTQGATNDR